MKGKFLGLTALLLSGIISIIGSGGGGGGDSNPSPPDLTGQWHGSFVSADNTNTFDISFTISEQKGENFEGVWLSSSLVAITSGTVDGFVYPSDDGRWLVSLSLQRDRVTCCSPLFGCYDHPRESLDLLGYFENDSVIDEDAYHGVICAGETGTLTVARQGQE